MNANDYQKQAMRTSATNLDDVPYPEIVAIQRRIRDPAIVRLLHGAIGLCTEVGELQDALKKHIFYGAELDVANIAEECGDVFWYLAETLTAIDRTFIDTMERNIAKLRVRYPEKFDDAAAMNRDLEAERKELE